MKTPQELLLHRHQHRQPDLDRIRLETIEAIIASRPVATLRAEVRRSFRMPWTALWEELIWPCRRFLAGASAVWLVAVFLNESAFGGPSRAHTKARLPGPIEPHWRMALLAQRRDLMRSLDTSPTSATAPVLPSAQPGTKPRSQQRRFDPWASTSEHSQTFLS